MRCEFQRKLSHCSAVAPFIRLWKVFHHQFPWRGLGMAGVHGETGKHMLGQDGDVICDLIEDRLETG